VPCGGRDDVANGENLNVSFEMIVVNFLKPTGYVMHHQFDIQQLYFLSTLYLYFAFIWEQTATFAP
jgi:hypothetical protein